MNIHLRKFSKGKKFIEALQANGNKSELFSVPHNKPSNPESVELLKRYIGAYDNNSNFGLIWNSKYRIVDNNGKVYCEKTIELSNKILPPFQLRNNVKLNLSMDELSSIKTFTVEPVFESVDQKLKQKLSKMRQSIGYKY